MVEKEVIEAITKDIPAGLEVDTLSPEETEAIKNMMDLGVFYGSSKARTNPKMRKYILTNRSGFSVIDLEKTLEGIKKTSAAIDAVVASGGMILLVGLSPSVKGAIKEMAEELDLPHVTERWLGGTLTNFETISKRINQLKKLKEEFVFHMKPDGFVLEPARRKNTRAADFFAFARDIAVYLIHF